MSFPVKFYSFSKRTNSTKIPAVSDTATTYNCVFKGPQSLLRPTISLVLPITQAPTWNYCYIALFNRYYFVSDWRWSDNRIWEADLDVDVLGTYRTSIGNKSYYVLRSATEYNPDVIDSFYPTRANITKGVVERPMSDLWDAVHETYTRLDLTKGTYVVGMVSKKATDHIMIGGVTYYLLSWTGLQNIIQNLMSMWDGLSFDGAVGEMQKTLVDPFQYLYSVVWFPVSEDKFYHSLSMRPVQYGPFTFDNQAYPDTWVSAYTIDKFNFCQSFNLSFDVPKHPQVSTRGRFLKAAPFSTYHVIIPPFGDIVLDSSKLYETNAVSANVYLDPTTGNGILSLGDLGHYTAKVGIEIPMAQITTDIIGAGLNMAEGISHFFSLDSFVNPLGAITNGLSGIVSGVNSMMPQVTTKGGNGDFVSLNWTNPKLRYEFQLLVDEDLQDNGRPLCENWQPSAIPGYMVVENGTTEITGTDTEAERIRELLEGGFYYE